MSLGRSGAWRAIRKGCGGLLLACVLTVHAADPLPQPLTLEYALSLADAPHPQLQQADARVDVARAEQSRVDAIDNVKVDLELAARLIDPSYRSQDIEPSSNDSWAKLRIHKQLYDFGRNDYLTEAADAQFRGRQLELLNVRQQRRLEVTARYFDVLLADLEQARDTEAMAIAFVRLGRARSRNELGQLSDIDLLELESRYQELLRRQRASQAKQRASRSRLALSLNLPDQPPSDLEFPVLSALQRPPGEVEPLEDAALADNPELRALREAVAAARKRTEAARAGNGAVIRGEIQGAAYNRSLGSSDPFVAALVWMCRSPPVVPWKRKQRDRALMRQKQAQLAARELEVCQTVLDLWLELQTLDARRRELESLGEFRELDFDRSRTLYELEATSDLGDAMARISEVRLLQAQTDFKTALAWARLDALTGRLIGAPAEARPQTPNGAGSDTE